MASVDNDNWHAQELNCLDWAKEWFEGNLVGLKAKSDSGDVTVAITGLKQLDGDAILTERKGRPLSLFDLKLVLNFASETSNGTITIPEVAFDSEPEDYQFELSFEKEGDSETRPVLRKKLIPEIRGKLASFGPTLLAVHTSGSEGSSSASKAQYVKPKVVEKTVMNKAKATPLALKSDSDSSVPAYNTTSVHLVATFNTSAEQLYKTLLEPDRVSMWTRSSADIKPVEGSEFHIFGGSIEGQISKLVANKEIVEKWRLRSWKQGHFAALTIKLDQGQGETKMDVQVDGVPVGEEELVEENFKEKYIQSIKMTFGFGAVL